MHRCWVCWARSDLPWQQVLVLQEQQVWQEIFASAKQVPLDQTKKRLELACWRAFMFKACMCLFANDTWYWQKVPSWDSKHVYTLRTAPHGPGSAVCSVLLYPGSLLVACRFLLAAKWKQSGMVHCRSKKKRVIVLAQESTSRIYVTRSPG